MSRRANNSSGATSQTITTPQPVTTITVFLRDPRNDDPARSDAEQRTPSPQPRNDSTFAGCDCRVFGTPSAPPETNNDTGSARESSALTPVSGFGCFR